MQWIKEVEMVDSMDDLKSSSSARGIQMQNFEVLHERIASALNRIIHNSHFRRRISLQEQKAQKQDLPTYSLSVYEMTIFRNSIQSGLLEPVGSDCPSPGHEPTNFLAETRRLGDS